MTLVDRLHALRESLYGSEHDEKRRLLADAIARIEAADGLWADIENGVRALQVATPQWTQGCNDMRYSMPAADYTIALNSALKVRALVREQDGGEK